MRRPVTDEEVNFQFTVLAVVLAAPYLNGDHGELASDIRNDIQGTLWRHGYLPARRELIASGATPVQVERATLAMQSLLHND